MPDPINKYDNLINAQQTLYAEINGDVAEIKRDLHDIRKILMGNGRGGLIERVALLEQQAGVGRYILTAAIGIGAALLTAILLRGLP